MKAAVYDPIRPPTDVLQIEDVEKPVPKDDEVLIRVRAAAVNPLDYGLMSGGSYDGSPHDRPEETQTHTTRR